MKRSVLVFAAIASSFICFAQAKHSKKDWSKIDLSGRPGDHFMLQLSSDYWSGSPDSIKNHEKGLARGGNIYLMIDKPFKSNPRLSIGLGLGVGTSSMYFQRMSVDIKSISARLPFKNLDTSEHFKKYKLVTSFLEIPVELRFSSDPEHYKKSIKAALGIKVGTLLNAHTKGKDLENRAGAKINSYTLKESKKTFFNTSRISVTGRFGIGNFSVFGCYAVTNLFKDGTAAAIKPWQVGICLSGL